MLQSSSWDFFEECVFEKGVCEPVTARPTQAGMGLDFRSPKNSGKFLAGQAGSR
jgi:hypothetical protein